METTMDKDTVKSRLLALQRMRLPELHQEWEALFHHAPPGYGEQFMRKRLAWRVQELAYGGIDADTERRIAAEDGKVARRETGLRLGTLIVREWHGVRHEVRVVRDGFEYNGRIYGSLSAVARGITGVNRNGREFFGMRGKG